MPRADDYCQRRAATVTAASAEFRRSRFAMTKAARAAARDGSLFAVTSGWDAVRRLFEMFRLDGQLPIDRSAA